MKVSQKIIITENNTSTRVDKFISSIYKDKSRNYLSSLISSKYILVNNLPTKASYKLKVGDVIDINIPEIKPYEINKENIPLDIIYEDSDILIINKPQGLVVHPAPGNYEHTLVNAIMYHCDSLSGINGVTRPGIVHRIDKDTSGLICVAKNDSAHQALSEQLKSHTMKRTYIALVRGVIKENSGTISLPIGRDKSNRLKMAVTKENSKEAITNFKVIKRYPSNTLIECNLVTGRTHQIRVHMSHIGYPIEGDVTYGPKDINKLYDKGQLLVAYKLHLIHPTSKKEIDFEIPLPSYFVSVINSL